MDSFKTIARSECENQFTEVKLTKENFKDHTLIGKKHSKTFTNMDREEFPCDEGCAPDPLEVSPTGPKVSIYAGNTTHLVETLAI